MAAVAAIIVAVAFLLGYRFYAKFLGERVFGDRDELVTPAHTQRDDQDFVPTPKPVLFGHHFTSIAGAAPIIGPCVAAYWGWGPALLWVVLGTIFMGAAHDFGSLVASAKEQGRSIADIAGATIGRRARVLFLCFVLVLLWLVLAVFAMAIASLFVSQPSSVLPINIQIVVAVIIGWLAYKKKAPLGWPSFIALLILYAFVWIGTKVPVDLTTMGMSVSEAKTAWIVFLFVYCAAASLLPVWILLQPRDYINSHQLFVGLGLLFAGLIVAHPDFDAPMLRLPDHGAPPIFPLLFVTIACGAISGFHGLVASGTTSKQLDKLSDARAIGYGSMLGEGSLALAATLAAVAGIGLVGASHLPAQGAVADLGWATYYDTWEHASANKAAAFVLGGGAFLQSLGLPSDLAQTLMAVLVIAFAATSLDTAARIARLIVSEIGQSSKISVLKNRYIATALGVGPALYLCFAQTVDPSSGQRTAVGWVLWPIFGASNQLLAAFTLMTLALYFAKKGKSVIALWIPMGIVTAFSGAALLGQLQQFLNEKNLTLAGLTALLMGLLLWMSIEGVHAYRQLKREASRTRSPQ
ncbi:MAG: carbon starvation protein A [Polyangiales bacterium]